jgi:citrate synthase
MKKTIQIDGNTTNEFSGYHKISDIEEYLKEMKTKGYTHIDIIYDAGYEEVDFVPYYERLETDAEYEQRLSRMADVDKNIKLNELKELERLKEKYEKENK